MTSLRILVEVNVMTQSQNYVLFLQEASTRAICGAALVATAQIIQIMDLRSSTVWLRLPEILEASVVQHMSRAMRGTSPSKIAR